MLCISQSTVSVILTLASRLVQNIASLFIESGEDLWKSVTSVSNAGRKRGRGRGPGRNIMQNLNRGQIIGSGKVNIYWPGLSGPVLRGTTLVKQEKLPEDPDREKKILDRRVARMYTKRLKTSPLLRGWTSKKMGGRSIGPPDPIGEGKILFCCRRLFKIPS